MGTRSAEEGQSSKSTKFVIFLGLNLSFGRLGYTLIAGQSEGDGGGTSFVRTRK